MIFNKLNGANTSDIVDGSLIIQELSHNNESSESASKISVIPGEYVYLDATNSSFFVGAIGGLTDGGTYQRYYTYCKELSTTDFSEKDSFVTSFGGSGEYSKYKLVVDGIYRSGNFVFFCGNQFDIEGTYVHSLIKATYTNGALTESGWLVSDNTESSKAKFGFDQSYLYYFYPRLGSGNFSITLIPYTQDFNTSNLNSGIERARAPSSGSSNFSLDTVAVNNRDTNVTCAYSLTSSTASQLYKFTRTTGLSFTDQGAHGLTGGRISAIALSDAETTDIWCFDSTNYKLFCILGNSVNLSTILWTKLITGFNDPTNISLCHDNNGNIYLFGKGATPSFGLRIVKIQASTGNFIFSRVLNKTNAVFSLNGTKNIVANGTHIFVSFVESSNGISRSVVAKLPANGNDTSSGLFSPYTYVVSSDNVGNTTAPTWSSIVIWDPPGSHTLVPINPSIDYDGIINNGDLHVIP